MGKLRDRMRDDMLLRGLSESTIKIYTDSMSGLVRFLRKSPMLMTSEDVRSYFLYLVKERKASYTAIHHTSCALKFFLRQYGMQELEASIPKMKRPEQVAAVMNVTELEAFMNSLDDLRKRAIFVTIYSSGLRVGELCRLELRDLDPERRQIRIRSAKGRKDRYTILFPENLAILRAYIAEYRPQSHLFYPRGRPQNRILERRVEAMFVEARVKAGIRAEVRVHTLRHTFATQLLENGVSIFAIQRLLGHASILSTMKYLHIRETAFSDIQSPLHGCNLQDHFLREGNQIAFSFGPGNLNWPGNDHEVLHKT